MESSYTEKSLPGGRSSGQRTTKQQIIERYATLHNIGCQSPFLCNPVIGCMPHYSITNAISPYFSIQCSVTFRDLRSFLSETRNKGVAVGGAGGAEMLSLRRKLLDHINMYLFPGINNDSFWSTISFPSILSSSEVYCIFFFLNSQLPLCGRWQV